MVVNDRAELAMFTTLLYHVVSAKSGNFITPLIVIIIKRQLDDNAKSEIDR